MRNLQLPKMACVTYQKKKKKNFIGAYLTGHHFNV